jgi:hypothetical protein
MLTSGNITPIPIAITTIVKNVLVKAVAAKTTAAENNKTRMASSRIRMAGSVGIQAANLASPCAPRPEPNLNPPFIFSSSSAAQPDTVVVVGAAGRRSGLVAACERVDALAIFKGFIGPD